MSSKGRGAPVTEAEFYPTPAWCTRRILGALSTVTHRRSTWLEPCAGDGAITRIISELSPDSIIDGGDIRSLEQPESVNGDWLSPVDFREWTATRDVVITNPPFSLAPELIAHFLPRCQWLMLLLRSSFKLVSGDPYGLKSDPDGCVRSSRVDYRDNMPDEYKLPQRPSFIASEKCKGTPGGNYRNGCGWAQKFPLGASPSTHCPRCNIGSVQRSTSDSSEYSWFVWTPERGRNAGMTRVLPDTPLSERKET